MIKHIKEPKSETIDYVKCNKCIKGIYWEEAGEGSGVGIVCPFCKGMGRRILGVEQC